MFTFQQSGLVLLAETGTDYEIILSPVPHKSATWWKLEIEIDKEGKREMGLLHNALGKPRLFKQLTSAAEFIQEMCPHIEKATVHLQESTINE